MASIFKDNKEEKRFELFSNGALAFADYRVAEDSMYIDYVFAPPELRGTGAAGELMQHIVDIAAEKNLHIVPICSYAVSWLTRHRL